jgi:hypothetical protein
MQFIWADDAITSLGGTLLSEPRLGVAFKVERGFTGGPGLEFMYDHRQRDSRLAIHNEQGLIFGD